MTMRESENAIPTIFNEIIRKRIAAYIDGEIKELVQKKTDEIISEVLSNLQTDSELLKDMYRHETTLVVKAIYNGQNIQQQPMDTETK